jgi:hypothetical protein
MRRRRAAHSSGRVLELDRRFAAIITGDESGLRQLAELLAPYLPSSEHESDGWMSTREAAEFASLDAETRA